MELNVAQQIGGRQTVRILFAAVLVVEFYLLIAETRGDFANGILFYLAEQLNVFVLCLFLLLFITTYFWGRSAGKAIIIEGRNYLLIGLKYSFLQFAIVLSYFIIVYTVNNATQPMWRSLLSVIARMTTVMICIWLFSAWRINIKGSLKTKPKPDSEIL
jgi:hypothetical protein